MDEEDREEDTQPGWVGTTEAAQVMVETGRGNAVGVAAGAPFRDTVEQIAHQANYGGYFRVFLNGDEIINPIESPTTIEAGMRIAVTSYDKVGSKR